jgi:hypothetical protein
VPVSGTDGALKYSDSSSAKEQEKRQREAKIERNKKSFFIKILTIYLLYYRGNLQKSI